MGRVFKAKGRVSVENKVYSGTFEVDNELYNRKYSFFKELEKSGEILPVQGQPKQQMKAEEVNAEQVKDEKVQTETFDVVGTDSEEETAGNSTFMVEEEKEAETKTKEKSKSSKKK